MYIPWASTSLAGIMNPRLGGLAVCSTFNVLFSHDLFLSSSSMAKAS